MKMCVALILLCSPLLTGGTFPSLLYSYHTGEGGGIGILRCADPDGSRVEHRVLWEQSGMGTLKKVSVSEDGRFVAANREGVEDLNNLVVVDRDGKARFYSFKDEVDHIDFHGNLLYIATTAGELHRLDPANGQVEVTWNFRKLLTPGGRRPESFCFDETHRVLWVSFQKDSKKRKHLGSRIVGIDLRTDRISADLQLPRDRPELHYAPEVDGRESGPNPEVLRVDADSNTLFATLDLYGGVAMMDLDAALQGQLKNYSVHSTAPDGSWGTAFPDRVGNVRVGGQIFYVVSNASVPGGAVVVDPRKRAIVQRLEVPGGLTTLEALPGLNLVISGNTGKVKSRESDGLGNVLEPRTHWVTFRYSEDGATWTPKVQQDNEPLHQIAAVDAERSPLVYLNRGEGGTEWLILHPSEKGPRTNLPAFGRVVRLAKGMLD